MIMNTVFNFLNRNNSKRALFSLLISIMFSFHANAQECATVSFDSTIKNNQAYVSMIVDHNGKVLEKTTDQYEIINGENEYYLAVGQHTLTIEQGPEKIYRKLKKGNKISAKYNPIDISSRSILLNVKAGRYYQLEFVSKNGSSASVKVKHEKPKSCEGKRELILQAKVAKDTIGNSNVIELPEPLEYRLRRLMSKLSNYHQISESDTFGNFFNVKFNGYIGTTIDTNYQNNGSALQVLSVLPYSIANKLQLMSGDKITHLNGEKIKADSRSPDQQLGEYFSALYFGEPISINVLRNGSNINLSGVYSPIILPRVSYQISEPQLLSDTKPIIKQYRDLSASLQFELDQLILEIAIYYQNRNYNQPQINISRTEKLDRKVGLSGNLIALPKDVGLKIEKIDENSFAQSLGLLKNDIIVNINNKKVTEKNINHLLKLLVSLKQDDEFLIKVKRDNRYLTLEEQYQSKKLASFNLMIDLKSIEGLSAKLAKASERRHKQVRALRHNKLRKYNGNGHGHGRD